MNIGGLMSKNVDMIPVLMVANGGRKTYKTQKTMAKSRNSLDMLKEQNLLFYLGYSEKNGKLMGKQAMARSHSCRDLHVSGGCSLVPCRSYLK